MRAVFGVARCLHPYYTEWPLGSFSPLAGTFADFALCVAAPVFRRAGNCIVTFLCLPYV
jgi:hypothetical protein